MKVLEQIWMFLTTSENWSGTSGIGARLWLHIWVSTIAVLSASAIGLPTGIALGHWRRGRFVATTIANLGRAIPSLAVLAFVLAAGGGIGFLPTYVAMVALAVPPIFVSTVTGVSEVDHGVIDAGRGAGMSVVQLLRHIEVPLAVPLIVSGLRIAATQVVATATLGTFVGYNTLGGLITVGTANRDDGMLYGGVVLVVGLALVAEVGFRVVQRRLTPWNRSRVLEA